MSADAITLKPKPYIGISSDDQGYFAVKMYWNPDGFYEPGGTGFGRFDKPGPAIEEAKTWAASEKLAFHERPPGGAILSRTALNPKAAWPFPEIKA